MQYQSRLEMSSSSKYVRDIKTSDYIWGPQGNILKNSKGTEYQTIEYHPFSDKSYTVKNPASQKNGKFLIKTTKNGQKNMSV